MELLRKLSADRGILAVMAKYKWAVALLKEFPPADGKVGVRARSHCRFAPPLIRFILFEYTH